MSELIYDHTDIRLSTSTLKRIWSPNHQNMPHPGTLDALAKFVHFQNWYEFKKQTLVQNSKKANKNTPTLFRLNKRHLMGAGIFLLIPITLFLLSSWNKNTNPNFVLPDFSNHDILFTSKKQSEGIPNSVIFNYDVSNLPHDSAFIQQSWDSRMRKRIKKEDQFYTCQYYYPGYFQAKLVLNDQIVKQHPVHITTNGWQTLVQNSIYAPIPTYIPKEAVSRDNQLHITPEIVSKYVLSIENNSYWTNYYNVQDFGISDADDFVFEAIVKNDIEEGGLTCQFTQITIIGEHGRFVLPLAAAGCVGEIKLVASDVALDSKNNDLSSFGRDLSQWQRIRCEVQKKNVNIFLDNELARNLKYNDSVGKIVGLRFKFHGPGAIRFVQLRDKDDTILFEEQFNALSKL